MQTIMPQKQSMAPTSKKRSSGFMGNNPPETILEKEKKNKGGQLPVFTGGKTGS
jgi:hypothetical protein